MNGFQFRSLQFTGSGLPPARVDFTNGLNVISGASDAGKSFIFSALDFACGAAGQIEPIPEMDGYTEMEVSLESSDTVLYSLRRSVLGGEFILRNLSDRTEPEVQLGEKYSRFDPKNISSFLLRLCGLEGRKIRKNAQDQLQDLSFRNLAHLVLVGEEVIIKRESPVHGGESILKTLESNIFKMLLTGEDDASVIPAKKSPKVAKAELQAQVALLEKLIGDYKRDLAEQTADPADLETQAARLGVAIQRAQANLSGNRDLLSQALSTRRTTLGNVASQSERRDQVRSLLARFGLLDEHYTTDLARLDALAEAGSLFLPLQSETCPLCGAPRHSHSHPEEQSASVNIERVKEACVVETRKIEALRTELREAISTLESELRVLDGDIESGQLALSQISEEIRGVLEINLDAADAVYRELSSKRYQVQQALSLHQRIVDLERRNEEASSALNRAASAKATRPDLSPSGVEALRSAFSGILAAWRFPVDGNITFDTKNEDFILGSRRRRQQGKGSRALTHAAFSIALMESCTSRGLAHPGFVALDSPLVTFRDKDADAALPLDVKERVKDAFYANLSSRAASAQIIIFENEEPVPDVQRQINFLHFTGDPSIGRKGFFPKRG